MVLKLYNTESVQEFPNCIVFIYVFPDFIIFIYIYIKRKELQDQKQKMENKKPATRCSLQWDSRNMSWDVRGTLTLPTWKKPSRRTEEIQ